MKAKPNLYYEIEQSRLNILIVLVETNQYMLVIIDRSGYYSREKNCW